MEALIILAVGVVCCIAFLLGAIVGQRVVRGQEIKLPEVKGPVAAVRAHRQQKEADREQEKLEIMLQNIDDYNGTEMGQRDLP